MNEWLNDFYGAFLVNFCDLKKKLFWMDQRMSYNLRSF